MAKTDMIHIRIAPEVKQKSEEIFDRLGINTSYAISLFLNQVILREGIPFNVELPKCEELTESEVFAKAIESTGGNGSVSDSNRRIMHLYAMGEIDYETALFAIKRSFIGGSVCI